jgi:hypothetical protein
VSEEAHSVRLDRVEGEVGAIRSEMSGMRTDMSQVQADVKGLGAILSRIEQGVLRAQEQQDQREALAKHSPVAIATVLVTIMSLLVGGAWMIGSNVARVDERSQWMERQQELTEQHVWVMAHPGHNGGATSGEPAATVQ